MSVVACGPSHENADDDSARAGSSGSGAHAGADAAGGSSGAGATGGATGANGGTGGSVSAGSGGTATGAGGTHAAAGDGGTTGGTGGRASGGSGAGGTGGAQATTGGGQIQLLTLVDYPNSGQAATTLNARFWSDAGGADSCSPTALGMCTLYNCPSAQAAGGPDAGAITVTSADAAFSQTLTFNTNGSYSTYGDSHPDFVGGEHVSVSTTGGTVPAFSDQLDYPLLLLLTNPVPADPSSVITIPVDQDLTLGWDRGTAGVSFALQSVTTADTYLTCEVPSELGSFTLPASTLAMLPSGTTFVLFTVASHSIVAGNYDVNVLVAGTVMWPDKMYRVMLQLGQ